MPDQQTEKTCHIPLYQDQCRERPPRWTALGELQEGLEAVEVMDQQDTMVR